MHGECTNFHCQNCVQQLDDDELAYYQEALKKKDDERVKIKELLNRKIKILEEEVKKHKVRKEGVGNRMQLQKSAIVLLREEKSRMISEKRLEDLKTKAIIKEKNELLAKNKKMAAEIQKLKGERETAGAQAEKLETSLRQELKNRKYEIDVHVQQQRKQQALIQETKEKTVKQLDDNELRIAGEKIGLDDELEVIVVEEDKMKGELAKEQESEVKKLKETNKRQKEELTSKDTPYNKVISNSHFILSRGCGGCCLTEQDNLYFPCIGTRGGSISRRSRYEGIMVA